LATRTTGFPLKTRHNDVKRTKEIPQKIGLPLSADVFTDFLMQSVRELWPIITLKVIIVPCLCGP